MKNISKFYMLACLLLLNFALFAQGGPGGQDGDGDLEGGDYPPGAPINSKLIILAILGIVFVLYTYRKCKKRNLI